MRLSVKALAIVSALLWGGCVLFVGLVNVASPSYGAGFLTWMSSVYPGFHDSHRFADVLIGTGYGLVDGAVGGFLFGRLYNFFARQSSQA